MENKTTKKVKAVRFLEKAIINNHCIDLVFVMKTFELNRKELEECIKIAEQKLELK